MNKIDLIITYVLAFICIYYLHTLDYPADWNLPLLMCFLLIYPITYALIRRNPKIEKYRLNNERELNKIASKYLLSFVYFCILFISFTMSVGYNTDKGIYPVAIVTSPEKANEIQTLLTKLKRSTGRRVIENKENGEIKYLITLSRYELNEEQYKEAVSELVNSKVVDDSVKIYAEEK